jgi:mono/diheme cytochrome c family protein
MKTLLLLLLTTVTLPAADPAAVLALFDQKCGDCHSEGDETPTLTAGINLTSLLNSEEEVKSIIDRVERGDEVKGRMPKSKGKPGDPGYAPPLTTEEVALLKDWAKGEAKPPVPTTAKDAPKTALDQPTTKNEEPGTKNSEPRTFIPLREEIRLIAEDVEKLTSSTQPFVRYLTLTNLANLRDAAGKPVEDETQLDTYRAAISKLLNSLSHEGQITVPVAVDAGKTIYRFDLRDYGWTAEEWEKHVVAAYPYALRGVDGRREKDIATATNSQSAWVRADWFTFAASQPPMYNQLLRLPDNDRDLEKELGVDVVANLQSGRAIRAGFRESGVSQGNRMIERHELGRYPGGYWKSYDFSPLERHGRHDLFRSPLGPVGAGLTPNKDREFAHDGGEIIWNLRNGLQAYYLSTAAGVKLDRAPTEIVQDRKRRDGAIINGISCMACHDQGMKYTLDKPIEEFRDEVGVIALKAGLDRTEANHVKDLYVSQEKLHEAVKADEERFKTALAKAMPGYDQPIDPVIRLYNRFKTEVKLETVAAEFGEEDARFLDRLKDSRNADLESIASQLGSGLSFPRAGWLDQFQVITRALGQELMDYTPIAYTEFTSGAAKAGGNEGKVTLSEGGRLTLVTDKAHYVKGDLLTVKVKSTEGVFLRLYHLSAEKVLTQIFPNSARTDNFLKGGETVDLGSKKEGDLAKGEFRFRMGEPFGTEIILAVASPVQFTDKENLNFAQGEVFKQFDGEHDLRKSLTRGTKGLTVETQDATGKETGLRSAPHFTARAVFTVSEK